MKLKDAYAKWGAVEDNRHLFRTTRSAFSRVWANLDYNQEIQDITFEKLGQIMFESSAIQPDKTNAASVMVHVLNFAADYLNACKKPDFKYQDILKFIPVREETIAVDQSAQEQPQVVLYGLTGTVNNEESEEMEQEKKNGTYSRKVAKIDPQTLKVVKVYDSVSKAQQDSKASNIARAIEKKRIAGGFYWADAENTEGFKPDKKSKPRKKVTLDPSLLKPGKQALSASDTGILQMATLDELVAELKRRGVKGSLEYTVTLTL